MRLAGIRQDVRLNKVGEEISEGMSTTVSELSGTVRSPLHPSTPRIHWEIRYGPVQAENASFGATKSNRHEKESNG